MFFDDEKRPWLTFVIRAALAAPLWYFGVRLAFMTPGGWGALPAILFGMWLMLVGAMLTAPSFARFLAAPAGKLFYPTCRAVKPGPVYSPAEAKWLQADFAGALAEYERLAAEFPAELRPHLELLRLTVLELEDRERGQRALDRALAAFPDPATQAALRRQLADLLARLSAKHDTAKKIIPAEAWMFEDAAR